MELSVDFVTRDKMHPIILVTRNRFLLSQGFHLFLYLVKTDTKKRFSYRKVQKIDLV